MAVAKPVKNKRDYLKRINIIFLALIVLRFHSFKEFTKNKQQKKVHIDNEVMIMGGAVRQKIAKT